MFLRERATQAEYCDRPDLPDADVAANYLHLGRFNRVVHVADPFQRLLVRWLGRTNVSRLTFLDLGAGNAALGPTIESWARRHGWDWRVTSLDGSPRALRLGQGPRRVAADVCALPFADNSFDVVMASQMTHHLTEEQTVRHFAEAWRVTRDVLFLTDTHRNVASLSIIWVILKLLRVPGTFLGDGMLSVRRGWRVAEWRELARRARIPNGRVSVYYASRIFLQARKGSAAANPRP
jgi:2-polyprenyl-3-methyl-5-hydroxy-6-metoxy-1,4-benzoquinol methylase